MDLDQEKLVFLLTMGEMARDANSQADENNIFALLARKALFDVAHKRSSLVRCTYVSRASPGVTTDLTNDWINLSLLYPQSSGSPGLNQFVRCLSNGFVRAQVPVLASQGVLKFDSRKQPPPARILFSPRGKFPDKMQKLYDGGDWRETYEQFLTFDPAEDFAILSAEERQRKEWNKERSCEAWQESQPLEA